MRTVAVAVAILSSCLIQEVSGSEFLGKDAPNAGAALKESTKDDKKQNLVVDKKAAHEDDKKQNLVVDKKDDKKQNLVVDKKAAHEKEQHEDKQENKKNEDKQESKKDAKVQDKKDANPAHEKNLQKQDAAAEKAVEKPTEAEKAEMLKAEKARYERVVAVHEELAKAGPLEKIPTEAEKAERVKATLKAEKARYERVVKAHEEVAKAVKAQKEALKKMSETNGAPSQGFNEHNDKTVNVEHDDMKTQAADWGGEWPQTDETDAEAKARICRTQEVQSKWCKDLGFASLLERESLAITPMEDSYDPDSDANNPENPEHRHDQEVHGGDFFQSVHHTWDDVDPSTMAMDRVSSDAEQRAVNHEFLAPHNQYDAPMSFLQTSQSSQPREKTALEEYQDNQIAEGLQEAELLPRVSDIATDDQ